MNPMMKQPVMFTTIVPHGRNLAPVPFDTLAIDEAADAKAQHAAQRAAQADDEDIGWKSCTGVFQTLKKLPPRISRNTRSRKINQLRILRFFKTTDDLIGPLL